MDGQSKTERKMKRKVETNDLKVNGNIDFTGSLTKNGVLYSTGSGGSGGGTFDGNLNGTLNVVGNSNLTGDLSITGNQRNWTGFIYSKQGLYSDGMLHVSTTNRHLITGPTHINGDIIVKNGNDLTLDGGNLGVTGNTIIDGNLGVTGNLNITGGSVFVNGTELTGGGGSSFNGSLSGTLDIDGGSTSANHSITGVLNLYSSELNIYDTTDTSSFGGFEMAPRIKIGYGETDMRLFSYINDSYIHSRGGLFFNASDIDLTEYTNPDLYIQNGTGYIGIGTTSPSTNLHVSGNANITGSLTVNGQSISGGSSFNGNLSSDLNITGKTTLYSDYSNVNNTFYHPDMGDGALNIIQDPIHPFIQLQTPSNADTVGGNKYINGIQFNQERTSNWNFRMYYNTNPAIGTGGKIYFAFVNGTGYYPNNTGSVWETLVLSQSLVSVGLSNRTVDLSVYGDIDYTGVITDISDGRFKDNQQIVNYDECYEKINKLELKSYIWNEQFCNENETIKRKNEIGFIAQEVEQIIPDAVKTKEKFKINGEPITDFKSVEYNKINLYLFGTTKKLMKENNELKSRMINIENKNDELKLKIYNIENEMKKLKETVIKLLIN